MPYCPKCDMEFIDGITTCSDCGGPLVESREAAEALKKEEEAKALAARQAEYGESESEADGGQDPAELFESASDANPASQMEQAGRSYAKNHVYVKKSQQYDDLKSSASAFLIVGGILLVFSVLCWTNIVRLPMAGISRIISQGVMTIMGIASLAVAVTSSKSAKVVESQVDQEENTTRQLIQWFADNYSADALDSQIRTESGELVPEELSLKRFELIQDILVTNHDITDQAYVDLISEDIYEKVYGAEA